MFDALRKAANDRARRAGRGSALKHDLGSAMLVVMGAAAVLFVIAASVIGVVVFQETQQSHAQAVVRATSLAQQGMEVYLGALRTDPDYWETTPTIAGRTPEGTWTVAANAASNTITSVGRDTASGLLHVIKVEARPENYADYTIVTAAQVTTLGRSTGTLTLTGSVLSNGSRIVLEQTFPSLTVYSPTPSMVQNPDYARGGVQTHEGPQINRIMDDFPNLFTAASQREPWVTGAALPLLAEDLVKPMAFYRSASYPSRSYWGTPGEPSPSINATDLVGVGIDFKNVTESERTIGQFYVRSMWSPYDIYANVSPADKAKIGASEFKDFARQDPTWNARGWRNPELATRPKSITARALAPSGDNVIYVGGNLDVYITGTVPRSVTIVSERDIYIIGDIKVTGNAAVGLVAGGDIYICGAMPRSTKAVKYVPRSVDDSVLDDLTYTRAVAKGDPKSANSMAVGESMGDVVEIQASLVAVNGSIFMDPAEPDESVNLDSLIEPRSQLRITGSLVAGNGLAGPGFVGGSIAKGGFAETIIGPDTLRTGVLPPPLFPRTGSGAMKVVRWDEYGTSVDPNAGLTFPEPGDYTSPIGSDEPLPEKVTTDGIDDIDPITSDNLQESYAERAVISLSVADATNSGVGRVWQTWYRIDDGEEQTGTTVIVTQPDDTVGMHTITYWSQDAAGNMADAYTTPPFMMRGRDTIPAKTTVQDSNNPLADLHDGSPDVGEEPHTVWGTFTPQFTSVDSSIGLGVNQIWVQRDTCIGTDVLASWSNDWAGSQTPLSFAPVPPPSGGFVDLKYRYFSYDKAGNRETARTLTVRQYALDMLAPSVIDDIPQMRAYVGDALIRLTADDYANGQGVRTIAYSLDGGEWITKTSTALARSMVVTIPVEAPAQGARPEEHTLQYYASDAATNENHVLAPNYSAPSEPIVFQVGPPLEADTTPPVTISDALTSYVGPATITLHSYDERGVAEVHWQVNGGKIESGASVYIDSPWSGSVETTLSFWAVDTSGNREATKTATFVISKEMEKPFTSAFNEEMYREDPARFQLIAADNLGGSGVKTTWYTDNGGAPKASELTTEPGLSWAQVAGEGWHHVGFYSEDNASNVEVTRYTDVLIDTLAPTTTDNSALVSKQGMAVINLTAVDAGSGVLDTWWVDLANNNAHRTNAAVPILLGPGPHTIEYWSVDRVGNTETRRSFTVNVEEGPDASAPVSFDDVDRSNPYFNRTKTNPAQLNLFSWDVQSGVETMYYIVDGGPTQTLPGVGIPPAAYQVLVSGEASHTVQYWAKDRAGHTEAEKSVTFKIDRTFPVTTCSAVADRHYWAPQNFIIQGSDSGSGVKSTFFRLDGGQAVKGGQVYVPAPLAGSPQFHAIEYWSVDHAGNEEPHRVVGVWSHPIDQIAPTTYSSAVVTYPSSAIISLRAYDNFGGSGVAATYYILDSQPVATGTVVFTNRGGPHTLEFWSEDVAGNVEQPHKKVTFTVNYSGPVTVSDSRPWYNSTAVFHLLPNSPDAGPDLVSRLYRVDGSFIRVGAVPETTVTVSGDGVHKVEFWSTDRFGNVEPTKSVDVGIDLWPPITTSNAVGSYSGSAVFNLSARDQAGRSEVKNTYWKVVDSAESTQVGSAVTVAGPGGTSTGAYTVLFWSEDNAGNVETPKSASFTIGPLAVMRFFGETPSVSTTITVRETTVSVSADTTGSPIVSATGMLDGMPMLPTVFGVTTSTVPGASSAAFTVTGGMTYTSGSTTYVVFKSSGSINIPSSIGNANVLVVGGGGGGGARHGGGGGAGRFISASNVTLTGNLPVTVGAGGAGASGGSNLGSPAPMDTAQAGQASAAFGLTAAGGGAGKGKTAGASGQGLAGGTGYYPGASAGDWRGAGGGGSSSVGGNASASSFGAGGAGTSSSILGSPTTYAAGGAGGAYYYWTPAVAGAPNTGNGGGASGYYGYYPGGAGGSGIVVVSFPTPVTPTFSLTGGTKVTKVIGGVSYDIVTVKYSDTLYCSGEMPNAQYLVVGGGGGGANNLSGGGGGGGVVTGTMTLRGVMPVTVGGAGLPSAWSDDGCGSSWISGSATNGEASILNGVSALGGGYGAQRDLYDAAGSGSSGGGGAGAMGANWVGGAGTPGQGFAGGRGTGNPDLYGNAGGGGGGGAGGVGSPGVSQRGGDGGPGVANSITGVATYYGGGGGGGSYYNRSNGGVGGGGFGEYSGAGTEGSPNTGGGGGAGAAGGSGVVIIRYPTPPAVPVAPDVTTWIANAAYRATGLLNGPHMASFTFVNAAGQRNTKTWTFYVGAGDDLNPPVTTADAATNAPHKTGSGSGLIAYYPSTATIKLSAVDDPGGTGVERTNFRLDGGVVAFGTPPTSTVTVSGEGTHTLEYWSTDRGGAVEATKTLTVVIDATPPTTTDDALPTYKGVANVTLTAHDNVGGSGVKKTYYTVDGAGKPTFAVTSVTGGTVTSDGNGRTVIKFTGSGSLVCSGTLSGADVLVVGGGGGGMTNAGGGGGGGGVVTGTTTLSGTMSITVGSGGIGGSLTTTPKRLPGNGTASSVNSIAALTAKGGGSGASRDLNGAAGTGSSGGGGGGAQSGVGSYLGGAGDTGTPKQGYNGGNGTAPDLGGSAAGGGGGGAGGAGSAGVSQRGGNGGTGVLSTIGTLMPTPYGGGGGGGCWGSIGALGGLGGGGKGDPGGTAGAPNTGGGGGSAYSGSAGGSGVVIISFPTPVDAALEGTSVVVAGPLNGDPVFHTIRYWSVDNVGNVESVGSATFSISADDQTPPLTTAAVNTVYKVPGTITLTAIDIGMGVSHTNYRLTKDGVPGEVATGTVMAGGDLGSCVTTMSTGGQGTYRLEYWSTDKLGNRETVRVNDYVVDMTAPVTSSDAMPTIIVKPVATTPTGSGHWVDFTETKVIPGVQRGGNQYTNLWSWGPDWIEYWDDYDCTTYGYDTYSSFYADFNMSSIPASATITGSTLAWQYQQFWSDGSNPAPRRWVGLDESRLGEWDVFATPTQVSVNTALLSSHKGGTATFFWGADPGIYSQRVWGLEYGVNSLALSVTYTVSRWVGPEAQTFATPGTGQTFTVPSGVTTISVTLMGGGGGGGAGASNTGSNGGAGENGNASTIVYGGTTYSAYGGDGGDGALADYRYGYDGAPGGASIHSGWTPSVGSGASGGGGGSSSDNGGNGGNGGKLAGVLNVVPGATVTVNVGAGGAGGTGDADGGAGGNGSVLITWPPSSGTQTFNPTGSNQSFTVPYGITQLTVDLYGAQGATYNYIGASRGGWGGRVQALVPVIPGEILTLRVGTSASTVLGGNGWPNGGAGGGSGYGGGGSTSILRGSTVLVEAGGGGGASSLSPWSIHGTAGGTLGTGVNGNRTGAAGSGTNGGGGGGWNGGAAGSGSVGAAGGTSYLSAGTLLNMTAGVRGTDVNKANSLGGLATISYAPAPTATTLEGGWTTIHLSASDSHAGSSGVGRTFWTLDGDGAGTHTGNTITLQGPASGASSPYRITFWSDDKAGNLEAPPKVATFVLKAEAAPMVWKDETPVPLSIVTVRNPTISVTGWGEESIHSASATLDGVAVTPILDSVGGDPTKRIAHFAATDLADGPHTVSFTFVTQSGMEAIHAPWTFVVQGPDNVPPHTTSDRQPTYEGPARITLTATDASSTVAATYYKLDSVTSIGTVIDVPAPQWGAAVPHTIQYWSIDSLENTETAHTETFTVAPARDTTPPVTTSSAQPVYTGPVNIYLYASDAGWGVDKTYYRLDGHKGGTIQVGTTVHLDPPSSASATHTLEFWSTDRRGNKEDTRSVDFTVNSLADFTPPVTVPSFYRYNRYPTTLTLTATDNQYGTGVDYTKYRLTANGVTGPLTTGTVLPFGIGSCTTPLSTGGEGQYSLSFWSIDRATPGNQEATKTISYWVDSLAPTTTCDATSTYTGPAVIRLSADDGAWGSGVFSTQYSLDGGAWTYGNVITVSDPAVGSAVHTLDYRSVDYVPNTEVTKRATFTVNSAPADITWSNLVPSANATLTVRNPEVSVLGTATTTIASTSARLNGSAVTVWTTGTSTAKTTRFNTSGLVDGVYTVQFTYTLTNGRSATKSWTFTVDGPDFTPPVTTSNKVGAYVGTATITLTAIDAAYKWTGVSTTYYLLNGDTYYRVNSASVDGVVVTAVTIAPPVYGTVARSLTYYSIDKAGNPEYAHTDYFSVTAAPDSTPPNTYCNAAGPYTGSATGISLQASDNVGGWGFDRTEYRIDGGTTQTVYTSTTAIPTIQGPQSGSSTRSIYYLSVDKKGNREQVKTATFTINAATDNTKPVTAISASHRYNGAGTIRLTATDIGQGVDYIAYRLTKDGVQGALTTTTVNPVTIGTGLQGTYVLQYWARDKSPTGNQEETKTWDYVVDQTRPGTVSDVSASSPITYSVTATVRLTATDPTPGASGIQFTTYQIDSEPARVSMNFGDATLPFVTNVIVPRSSPTGPPQTRTIRFWSTDFVNWAETPAKIATVTIAAASDVTSPTTTSDRKPFYNGPSTITLTATDGGWGVANTYSILDNGSVMTGRYPSTGGSGPHTLYFWSVDNAGNKENTQSVTYNVDMTPPVTTCTVNPVYTGSATLSLVATDGPIGSGVVATHYRVDGATQQTGTTVIVPAERAKSKFHYVDFWSIDAMGNVESPPVRVSFTVNPVNDTTAPALTDDHLTAAYPRPGTITLTASDAGWGVRDISYKRDSEATVTPAYSTTVDGVASANVPVGTGGGGSHILTYWASDQNSNFATRTISYTVASDTTSPTTVWSDRQSEYTQDVGILLTASDVGWGVDYTHYRLDGAAETSGTYIGVAAPLTGSQEHRLVFWSKDLAGNTEVAHEETFTIHAVPAVMTFSGLSPAPGSSVATTSAKATITATSNQNISSVVMKLDGVVIPSTIVKSGLTAVASADLTGLQNRPSYTIQAIFTCADGRQNSKTWTFACRPRTDFTPPETISDLKSSYFGTATISLTALDLGGDGVAYTAYKLDNSVLTTRTSNPTILTVSAPATGAPVPHKIHYWAIDVAGNQEATHTFDFTVGPVDVTPPVTTSNAALYYKAPSTIYFYPTDPNGSGWKQTYYRFDNETDWTAGTMVGTGGAGEHTLWFWSEDNAGCKETPKKVVYIVDELAPTTTSNAALNYKGVATVKLSVVDPPDGTGAKPSGVDENKTFYEVDGNGDHPLTGTTIEVQPPDEGQVVHYITFWSEDRAGNVEQKRRVEFTVDARPDDIAPVTNIEYQKVFAVPGLIRLSASDVGGWGVAYTQYQLDGNPVEEGLTIRTGGPLPEGQFHTLKYWSTDKADNTEEYKVATYTVAAEDVTPPVTISTDATTTVYRGSATIHLSATDNSRAPCTTYYRIGETGEQRTGTEVTVFGPTSGVASTNVYFWSEDINGRIEDPPKSVRLTISTLAANMSFDATAPLANETVLVRNPAITVTAHAEATIVAGVFELDGIVRPATVAFSGNAATLTHAAQFLKKGKHDVKVTFTDATGGVRATTWSFWVEPPVDLTVPDTFTDALPYYNSAATIDIWATDEVGGSGVASIHYSLDGGSPVAGVPPTLTLTVSDAGPHNLEYWSVDTDLNEDLPHERIGFNVDMTAPRTGSDVLENLTYSGTAVITLAPDDFATGSGIAETHFTVDGVEQQGTVITIPAPLASPQDHPVTFWSVDRAGNVETPVEWTITVWPSFAEPVGFSSSSLPVTEVPAAPVEAPVETIAPTTTSNALATYYGTGQIQLTAMDNVGGSGVAHVYYRWDDGPRVESTMIGVSGAGTHQVEFWSVDAAGNEETPVRVVFEVIESDVTAPTTFSNAAASYAGTATLVLTAVDNDGGSGVSGTYYRLDSGPAQSGAVVEIAPSSEGEALHTVSFWSIDQAGNVEAENTVEIAVMPVADTTAPVTALNGVTSYVGTATISLIATDGVTGSGVQATHFSVDDGPPQVGTVVVVPAPVSGSEGHHIDYYSVDNAGNAELVRAFAFSVIAADASNTATLVFRWSSTAPSSASLGYATVGDGSFATSQVRGPDLGWTVAVPSGQAYRMWVANWYDVASRSSGAGEKVTPVLAPGQVFIWDYRY